VLRTEATSGKGVPELVAAVLAFRTRLADRQGERRRARAEFRLRETLGHRFFAHVEAHVLGAGELDRYLDRVARREIDPYSAADEILGRALGQGFAAGAGPAAPSGAGGAGSA